MTKRAISCCLTMLIVFMLGRGDLYAQTLSVKGVVTTGQGGETLPGVTVAIKNTAKGTFTDAEGNYTIEASRGDVLVFSFVGYITQEITIGNETTINVLLAEDTQLLSEVVVIGYGTTNVKDATGSIAAIGPEDFNKGNIVTPENLLNGRVAGVTVNTGGAPGSGSTIRIRGGASLSASNDPLIVINGLPIDNTSAGGSRSILSTINPNEIESFTVLKDASATAIYGSRASNGVIIITTKEARGEFQVNLDMQTNISQLQGQFDVFSADEYRALIEERRPGLVGQLGTANTNWQDEIYRTGVSSNINLSAEGTLFDFMPGRIAIGRTYQEGIRLTSQFERTSVSANLRPTFLDGDLKVTLNVNYSDEKNRFAGGQEGNAISFDPTQPVYDSESPFGGFFQYITDNGDNDLTVDDLTPFAAFNPVAELLQRNDRSNVDRVFGNLKLEYTLPFLPELSATINMGYDEQSGSGTTFVSAENPTSQPDGTFQGSESNYTSYRINRLFDGYLRYASEFGKLNVEGTAGYSFQKFKSDSYTSGELRNDLPSSEPQYNAATDVVLIGAFGRANLGYDNRYFLTVSYRADGTSRFGPDNRWGYFPAVALSWKINEDLFPNSRVFSTMKLRAGYGITGQQDIGVGDVFLPKYQIGEPTSQYLFGNQIIRIAAPQFRNEVIKWEETITSNVGIDFGLFNDRFFGSLEYFHKESRDLLTRAAISDGSNFSNAGVQNLGNFTTQGVEFAITGDIIRSNSGLNWNANYNVTFLGQEITNLALDADILVGGIAGGVGNTIQIHRVGFAPYMFHVYKQVYDENGKPIEGGYADLNGDNQINQDDRYLHKNGIPDLTMGFLSNFSYRNFDLSFNLRAAFGHYIYSNVNSTGAQLANIQLNNVLSNIPVSTLDTEFQTTENVILSDYWLEKGDYLKLDNITLGYRFKNPPIKQVKNLRVSAGVQNVFVITNYSGIDPEVFGNGIDNTIYPRARTYYLSLNLGF